MNYEAYFSSDMEDKQFKDKPKRRSKKKKIDSIKIIESDGDETKYEEEDYDLERKLNVRKRKLDIKKDNSNMPRKRHKKLDSKLPTTNIPSKKNKINPRRVFVKLKHKKRRFFNAKTKRGFRNRKNEDNESDTLDSNGYIKKTESVYDSMEVSSDTESIIQNVENKKKNTRPRRSFVQIKRNRSAFFKEKAKQAWSRRNKKLLSNADKKTRQTNRSVFDKEFEVS